MSILKDGLFNHALRFLGQERILRYPGAYSRDELPNPLSPLQETLIYQTSPINRIPVEILGEIFTHYLYSKSGMGDPILRLSVSPSCKANPFLLGQVCGLWRHIVVTMPTLWQSLCVGETTQGCVHLVNIWLQRAGHIPLTIHLFEKEKNRDSLKTMHEIVLLVIQRLPQWKYIDFSISAFHQHAFSRLPVGQAAYLQYAKLDIATWDHANGDSIWRVLHSSPALTHVDWGGVYDDIDNMPDHVPWGQLTHISLPIAPDAASTLHALQACKSLIDVSIWGLTVPIGSLHEPAIRLPTLRTLHINACDDPGPFLQSLIIPKLTSLSIEHFFRPLATQPSQLSQSFRIFLEQSSCSLEHFTIWDSTINEKDLARYLSSPHMASLTDLTIQATLTDFTITALEKSNKQQCLLPNLRRIYLSKCHTTPGAFSDMVRSRISLLESVLVRFPFDHNVYEHDRISLQEMQIPDLSVIL